MTSLKFASKQEKT